MTPRTTRTGALSGLMLGVLLAAGTPARGEGEDAGRPAAITVEGGPTIPTEIVDRLGPYLAAWPTSCRGFAPDGTGMLVSSRVGETAQLFTLRGPGEGLLALTEFDEPCTGRFLRGDAQHVLVSMSRGGNEDDQIHRVDRT